MRETDRDRDKVGETDRDKVRKTDRDLDKSERDR